MKLNSRPSSVPSTKAAQCRRHAATLGLQVTSEFVSEVEGTESSDGLVHSNSRISRSSSHSNGEGHSSSGANGIIDEEMNLDNTGSSSNSVTKKRRSFLVKEDKPEKERVCSISTRYNGQRGLERFDKTRERQDVFDSLSGLGSDTYELGSSAKKRMRVDKSSGMSRRVRSSRVLEVPSSSQNPIDLCEDDSDVTTAETSDLPTGGTPDTPTSSDNAAEVASDVASEGTAELISRVAAVATSKVVVDAAAPEIAVINVKMADVVVNIDDTVGTDDTVRMDEIVVAHTDATELEAILLDPPSLEVEEALVLNCNEILGEQGLQTAS